MSSVIFPYTVSFFGHRIVSDSIFVSEYLEQIIIQLLREKEYVEFLVGRNGDFDQLVSSAICKIKKNFRNDNSSHVLVLAYSTSEFQKNEQSFYSYYDEIEICEPAAKSHYKAAIKIRNRIMVDRSDLVVCYIEHESGGAYQAVSYAKRQGKQVLNVAHEVFRN